MERIYLDNCCFNRPYDNQLQMRIHLETQAKLYIQEQIVNQKYQLVWSHILEYENSLNPFQLRREAILKWKAIASVHVLSNPEITEKRRAFERLGLKPKDALHLACAVFTECHYFITTDRGILKKKIEGIHILNPIDFVTKKEN